MRWMTQARLAHDPEITRLWGRGSMKSQYVMTRASYTQNHVIVAPHPSPLFRPGFVEVEDILREITQREATWGGMLTNGSGSSSAHASMSDRSANGSRGGDSAVGAGSINGRASAGMKGSVSRSGGRGEVGLLGAVRGGGVSNGGAGANEALTGTRTLV